MEEDKFSLKVVKIGLLGDSSVGKSSICQTLLGHEFREDILVTIGYDKFDTSFTLENGEKIKVVILDTAGQERFHSIALNTVKYTNGIVLVQSLTDKTSFENIEKWLRDINDNFENPCLVLFGNKADLKDQWQITSEEAKKYAEENKLIYFETSAKTKQGINEGFSYIANQTYKIIEQKLNKNIIIGKDKRKKIKSKRSSSK